MALSDTLNKRAVPLFQTRFADIGGLPTLQGTRTNFGWFVRGGSICGLSDAQRSFLTKSFGIGRVVDVRTGWERQEAPDDLIDGVECLFIPLFDEQVAGIAYTCPDFASTDPTQSFAIDRYDFYQRLANPVSTQQIGRVLRYALNSACAAQEGAGVRVLQQSRNGDSCKQATFIHCTNGKDRSAIIFSILFEMLGVPRSVIMDEYLAVNPFIEERHKAKTYRKCLALGGTEEQARLAAEMHLARRDYLETYWESVDMEYGSMQEMICGFLGFDKEEILQARRRFCS